MLIDVYSDCEGHQAILMRRIKIIIDKYIAGVEGVQKRAACEQLCTQYILPKKAFLASVDD